MQHCDPPITTSKLMLVLISLIIIIIKYIASSSVIEGKERRTQLALNYVFCSTAVIINDASSCKMSGSIRSSLSVYL